MSFDPLGQGPQKGLHPEDKRNMLIFVVASLAIWFAFDHFILKPRMDALQAQTSTGPQAQVPNTPAAEQILARPVVLEKEPRRGIETPELTGSVALKGLRIDDITLKNYYKELDKKDQVVLMSPSGTAAPHYAEIGWLAGDGAPAVPDRNTLWTVQGQTEKGDEKLTPAAPLTMVWNNGQGLEFSRTISVDEHYMFTVTQKVTNTSDKTYTLYPYSSIARRGIPRDYKGGVGFEGPIGYIADEMHEISYTSFTKQPETALSGTAGWIGFGEKYWLSSLIPSQNVANNYRFSAVLDPKDANNTLYQVDIRGQAQTLDPGKAIEDTEHVFVGVKKISLLNKYEDDLNLKHFDLAVDFGKLYFLTKPLYALLILFNGWVHNFGVAILLLTLAVRAAVFPLASASYRSFAKLRKVSPRMAELKIKYGDDKPRLQQELVKLYETEKVNPMAGCFPLLLQIPIFFAVYKVISIAVEMRHAPFFGWIHDLSAMDTLSIFNLCGLLPYQVPSFMHIGPWSVLMLIMMLIQKQLNPPPTDQIQKDIANYMPWIVTYTMSRFPVGLVIYWAFSNAFSVIQQMAIMRSMGVPVYLFSPDEARAHHESHTKEVEAVTERAKKEREATTEKKKDEVVTEALFDDSTKKEPGKE